MPNALFKDWLTKHYSGVINEAMSELKRPNLGVHFVADSQSDGAPIQLGPDEAVAFETVPALTAPGPAGLNPRYTFDTFIVGSSINSRSGGRAVAEAQSSSTTRCSSKAVWVW